MSFKAPQLDEIDGVVEPGRYKARYIDMDGPKPDGWQKPVVEFKFKLTSGPNKNEVMNIPFVGTTSKRLVEILTALNGGTYDPGADTDDYVGNTVWVTVEEVTKKDGKTYSNITKVEAFTNSDDDEEERPKKKKKKRRPEPEPEPEYDDDDDDDDDEDDDDEDDYDDYDDGDED